MNNKFPQDTDCVEADDSVKFFSQISFSARWPAVTQSAGWFPEELNLYSIP